MRGHRQRRVDDTAGDVNGCKRRGRGWESELGEQQREQDEERHDTIIRTTTFTVPAFTILSMRTMHEER
jgi:hypothetical protein